MIQLPELFDDVLKRDKTLAAGVRKTFDAFEPWLEQSGMPFFPGFTDHSPRHINDVLTTAASLISDSSRPLLSAEDVAILSLAILLHDCGMHITQDTFRMMVRSTSIPAVPAMRDLPWSKLWTEFLSEAQRWGEDRLQGVFGDVDPIEVGKIDLQNLNERDCLLVGEFVRRHHTRFAHEVAINGVPSPTNPLRLVDFDSDFSDLAGLTARSHGMSIRDTFGYITTRYGRIAEFRRVKIPYIMAVLRIADYVQVQSERALKSLLSVKELRSPISRQEWRNHFSVRDVTLLHEDPEAMYVNARPTDVKTFLRLDQLFKDIQRELDSSWATLGEVYGRLGNLGQLGLSIRRIRSSLDDIDRFSASVPYVPRRAGFESSGPELLKLLVGPLYEYDVTVGVRELVQNAVDACRERIDLEGISSSATECPSVVVDIQESEDGGGWIEVTDGGVGMTLETVTKYFLVAGASFRNSDVWKRQHVDDSGNIRIMRGGRFGIGALAAFLLGEELSVRTRHFQRDSSEGIEFTARMDEPIVELRRCAAAAGTSVKVWIRDPSVIGALRLPFRRDFPGGEAVVETLSWDAVDWFTQKSPRVEYRWNGYNTDKSELDQHKPRRRYSAVYRRQEDLVPHPGEQDPAWNELKDVHPYREILWQYPKEQKRTEDDEYPVTRSGFVTVNGIWVQDLRDRYGQSPDLSSEEESRVVPSYRVIRPSIAIFDPFGICPINLQRSSVSFEHMGIDRKLEVAIVKAELCELSKGVQRPITLGAYLGLCKRLMTSKKIRFYSRVAAPLGVTTSGIFLLTEAVVAKLDLDTVFFVDTKNVGSDLEVASILGKREALVCRAGSEGLQADLGWFRSVLSDLDRDGGRFLYGTGIPWLPHTAAVARIPMELWTLANEKSRVSRELLDRIVIEHEDKESIRVRTGKLTDAQRLTTRVDSLRGAILETASVAGWSLAAGMEQPAQTSVLIDLWRDLFRDGYL